MNDILVRIKRAVQDGRYVLSVKATAELNADGLDDDDIIESILNAARIYKTLRSDSPWRAESREYLYVIQSPNRAGLVIYTKGKFVRSFGVEVYYLLISCKKAY